MTRSNVKKSNGFGRKKLLSVDEAAILLGITRSTAYRAINNGTFPVQVIKLGGRLRISRAALDRVLDGDASTNVTVTEETQFSSDSCLTYGIGLSASFEPASRRPI